MNETRLLVLGSGRGISPQVREVVNPKQMHLTAASMRSLLEDLKSCSPECALVALPEGDVASIEEAIAVIKAADENLPIMVLLTSPSLQEVITVMKAGVYDCFAFPIDAERLGHAIANAVRLYRLTKKVYLLEQQMGSRSPFEGMGGTSQAMQAVFMLIKTVAKSQATVFIHGESGTGKELVAKALHRLSGREKKPFVDINCGAIPRQLLENELFGHERGAYTGADRRSIGSVERAHEGTLFLDEISEMDPALQVKLLRFLQERTFTRVGGNEPLSVNVRIVAATNRNLQGEVAAGRFREDLYYRLNVVPIELPPLRKRREDIRALAHHFLEKFSSRGEKIFHEFSAEAMERLCVYDWPGNVRELENAIERVVVLHNDSIVKPHHLLPAVREAEETKLRNGKEIAVALSGHGDRILPLELVERYAIEAALDQCDNVGEAAKALKIGQATLYRKIKQYGLRM